MKFRVYISLEGYIELEADSEEEAVAHVEDGFSIDQFQCEDAGIDEVEKI